MNKRNNYYGKTQLKKYVKSSLYFFLVIFNLYFGTFEFGARDM
jgi:hypothetical protein